MKKTGICKSVVIATVVAIRDVVKNGFHCTKMGRIEGNKTKHESQKKNPTTIEKHKQKWKTRTESVGERK